MGNLSDFQRGEIVGARLAGETVIKLATVLGVSKAAVPKVTTSYTDHGKTSANRNSGQRPKLCERDRCTLKRIVSKDHRITAANVTTTFNILRMDKIMGTVCKIHFSLFLRSWATNGL
jgi:hypothetical protein